MIKAQARDQRAARPLIIAQAAACLCCVVFSGAAVWFPAAMDAEPNFAAVPTDSAPAAAPDAKPPAQCPDGLYTGTAMGMNAPIKVSVKVKAGRIVDITIAFARDDEPYSSDALEVIDAVIAANSTTGGYSLEPV